MFYICVWDNGIICCNSDYFITLKVFINNVYVCSLNNLYYINNAYLKVIRINFYWPSVMDSVKIAKQILCVFISFIGNKYKVTSGGRSVCVLYLFPVNLCSCLKN